MAKWNPLKRAIWAYATTHAQFSVTEVATAISMDLDKCRAVFRLWSNKGYFQYIPGTGKNGEPFKYSVVPDANPQIEAISPQRAKTKRQKIWNSMKISRFFTAQSVTVTTDSSKSGALVYIYQLEKSGYLQRLCESERGGILPYQVRQLATYRLIRDTGRKAPIVRRDGCFDQNNGVFYPFNKGVKNEQNVA